MEYLWFKSPSKESAQLELKEFSMYDFLRGYWHFLLLALVILMAPVAILVPTSYSAPVDVYEIRFLEIQASHEKWYQEGEVSDEYVHFLVRDIWFRSMIWA